MALTGLDIYKRLPKENCKECGLPTCLAFAMKVASGQAGLDQCPRLTEEARGELDEASAPPQRLVKIGPQSKSISIGQETVLFRHDERFHHPTGIALKLSDSADPAALAAACERFKKLTFHRVGEDIFPDMVALANESGSGDTFAAAAKTIHDQLGVPMVLMSDSIEALAAAGEPLAQDRPVLYPTGTCSADELAALGQKVPTPLCVGGTLDEVAEKVEALGQKGLKDVLISPGSVEAAETLAFLTQTRRASLNKKFRPLGCPVLVQAENDDEVIAAMDACSYVCKYAGVLVTNVWSEPLLVPILTTRQNIYTDPQKPVQVEPRLYEIGEVDTQSPLLVTTNFSLSYYSVESEVEASRIGCRILAVDTEGTSVLTAWAADKFNPETIATALKKSGVEETLQHKRMVIPGHVAVLAAQLNEETGWQVLVGPKEASGIGPYLKNDYKAA